MALKWRKAFFRRGLATTLIKAISNSWYIWEASCLGQVLCTFGNEGCKDNLTHLNLIPTVQLRVRNYLCCYETACFMVGPPLNQVMHPRCLWEGPVSVWHDAQSLLCLMLKVYYAFKIDCSRTICGASDNLEFQQMHNDTLFLASCFPGS